MSFSISRARHALAAAALAAAAGPTLAEALYANFDPTGLAAGNYSTSSYADISGDCGNFYCNGWLNIRSAGFSFVAEGSGLATHAYLALNAISTYQGAERFYRISITNSAGEVVVQGGLLGRYVPLGQTAVYEFALNRDYEAGQVLAASAELVEGETYYAYFHQRFGSLSSTHWMDSTEAAAAGEAQQYCQLNTGGGICTYNWGSGWQYPYGLNSSVNIDGFLPTLALTDGNGWVAPGASNGVPEPASLGLVALGLLAAGMARRRA